MLTNPADLWWFVEETSINIMENLLVKENFTNTIWLDLTPPVGANDTRVSLGPIGLIYNNIQGVFQTVLCNRVPQTLLEGLLEGQSS